jgi:N-acetylneuraminic acid mutarotase
MACARVGLLLAAQLSLAAAQFTIQGEVYNHVWNRKADMPGNRSDMTATTVGDAIYLIGGCSGDQEWNSDAKMYLCSSASKENTRYAPASDTFTTLEAAPVTRYRHAAAAVGTKIYLFGGVDIQDNLRTQIDAFDTATKEWSSVGTMPNATTDLMAVSASLEGEEVIFVMGGYTLPNYNASDRMMIFYPQNNTFVAGPSMVQGRGDAFAGVAGGKVTVVGGFHHSNFDAPMKHVEMIDLAQMNGGWTVKRAMTVARGDKAVAVLNDVLHVIGGETKNGDGHSVPLKDVEAYDAAKDMWYPGGEIQSHRFRFVAASHGNSIYIFGGQGYLIGTQGAAGSKYPVYKMVEQYQETVAVSNEVSGARAAGAGAAAALAGLSLLLRSA